MEVFKLRKHKVKNKKGTQTHLIAHKQLRYLPWVLQFYREWM